MTTLTQDQINVLNDQAEDIIKRIDNGEKTMDVLRDMYITAFPGKTPDQATAVATTILDTIQAFDTNYAEAKVDIDHFIRKYQRKIDKNKSSLERCIFWKQFAYGINAITASDDENGEIDRDKLIEEINAITVDEDEVTDLLEEELRTAAFEALKDSNLLLGTMAANMRVMENTLQADEAAQLLVDLTVEDLDYRAVVSMLAYINAANGEYPDVPVDVSVSEMATAVCVEVEEIKIIDAFMRQDISLSLAKALIGLLGIVAIFMMTVFLTGGAIFAVTSLLNPILTIPAVIAVICGAYHALCKAVQAWTEDSEKIVYCVFKGVRGLATGFRNVFNFFKGLIKADRAARAKERMETLDTETQTATC